MSKEKTQDEIKLDSIGNNDYTTLLDHENRIRSLEFSRIEFLRIISRDIGRLYLFLIIIALLEGIKSLLNL